MEFRVSLSHATRCFPQSIFLVTAGLICILMSSGVAKAYSEPYVATDLEAEVRCEPVKSAGTARLRWKPASPSGGSQRLEMTKFRDGFENGQISIIGPLPRDQSETTFSSGEPGINYYWRVLTKTGSDWTPSKIARLPWPSCPKDVK
jgi:hypothetical protein